MNHYTPKLKRKDSYARVLLEFLQVNPNLEVKGTDFLWIYNKYIKKMPFLWSMPTSRLSELKEMWLIEITGKIKWIYTKTNPMNLYKITDKWLNFKLQ